MGNDIDANAGSRAAEWSRHPEVDENSLSFFGWRVTLGSVIGLVFSPGPLILLLVGRMAPSMEASYGWSIGRTMFGLTLFGIASMIAAPVFGWLVDRYGVRRVMLCSIVAEAACLVAFGAFLGSLSVFYLICFLFGVLGYGAQSLTYNKLLTEWFDVRRGFALGVASAGLGLGYVILPSIIVYGEANYGPRGTFFLMAAVVMVFSFGVNLFSAVSPSESHVARANSNASGLTLKAAARTIEFWLLAAAIVIVSAVVTGVMPQVAKLTHDIGYSPKAFTIISTCFGITTLCVRLLIGWLVDRSFAPRVGAIAFFLAAVGCAIVAACIFMKLPVPVMILGVGLVGVGYGTEIDLVGYLTGRYFGKKHFGAIYGCLMILFLCGVSISPLMYGSARTVFGTYDYVFVAAAVLAVVSAIAMLCLPRYPEMK